jgi:hypothetical protein
MMNEIIFLFKKMIVIFAETRLNRIFFWPGTCGLGVGSWELGFWPGTWDLGHMTWCWVFFWSSGGATRW